MEEKSDVQHLDSARWQPTAGPRKRNSWIWWTVFLLLAVLVGVVIFMNHQNQQKAATAKKARGAMKPTVTLTASTATKGSIGVYDDAIGTVTPVYTSTITAQAGGVITSVHYQEGQFVRQGDALIEIDPRPYEAQLLEAEGLLERDTNLL